MTNNDLILRVATIVSTLAEIDGSPESMLYVFCNMDMHGYETARDVLLQMELITIESHYVKLTAKGKDVARKINARIQR